MSKNMFWKQWHKMKNEMWIQTSFLFVYQKFVTPAVMHAHYKMSPILNDFLDIKLKWVSPENVR